MPHPYTVALVLDPEFGEPLKHIAESMHVWAVGTPVNRSVADALWNQLPKPYEHNIESGITTFDPTLGSGPESWCKAIVDTIDQHHDETSHDPPYTVLLVYGLQFSESLRPCFTELGFTAFEPTGFGFRAFKRSPNPSINMDAGEKAAGAGYVKR